MLTATSIFYPDFVVGPVRRETFGGFIEHLGRGVYGGIFEPGHPTANADGFRLDVLDLVRELGVTSIRYPGGNFVSGYRWEDGIGPLRERPKRLDLAWHSLEPNTFGLDEFIKWTKLAGVAPMLAVNLGTRGVQEALDLLEYCNIESGTYWSDLRVSNGAVQPHDVRMWCLGNEVDGLHQIGHKTAVEYGRLAAETARAMRLLDPKLTLVASGSCNPEISTFGTWEAEVLREAYDEVDLISAHSYFWEEGGDLSSFLASGVKLDAQIDGVVATVDHVKAVRKSTKRIDISFDEWNVWYLHGEPSKPPTNEWPVGPPLLEDHYSVADAVVFGGLLISLLRHSDRVVSASLAQLVNVIAPIMTRAGGPAWQQTTYYPFAQASALATGSVLQVATESPTCETAAYGPVPLVDAVATHNESTGLITVFAVNRALRDSVSLSLPTTAFGAVRLVEATVLSYEDPYRKARSDTARELAPRPNPMTEWDGTRLSVVLPPVSWNVIQLAVDRST